MTPEYTHELITELPETFDTGIIEGIEKEAGEDRVQIERREHLVRVAAADAETVRWLVGWLDDRPEDGAQGLADAIESGFWTVELPER